MSLKSREKALRREQEEPVNILAQQKKAAAKAEKYVRENYLHSVFLVLISCAMLFLMGRANGRSAQDYLMILSVPMACALWLLVQFFWRYRFLCIAGGVEYAGGEIREFVCRRVRLVTYPVSRFGSEFAGLVLIVQGGKKYRYVFPQPLLNCREERKRWRERCVGKTICCTCYRDTDIIKELNEM